MLKVAVVGGGSTYTPELLNGFLTHQQEFPLDELWLMDIDAKRLQVVGRFAQRIARANGAKFNIILSTDRQETIKDASYVITQFRVGQMQARREDEYLGLRHGLVGQETTGIGGMAKALRTIPVMLDIAREIERLAPEALLVNFTNPSGLITEALFQHAPQITSVGLCNAAITTKMEIIRRIDERTGLVIDPDDAQIQALGLNHLTWYYGFHVNGKDIWHDIIDLLVDELRQQDDPDFDPETIETLQMIPNSYLQYYYSTEKMVKKQEKWPPSRAEQVMEIEKSLLKKFADADQKQIPDELMTRGGAFYSTLAVQLLNAHYNNLEKIFIVNVRHNGAVPKWNQDWVLEMPCIVKRKGITPVQTPALPLVCTGLLTQVKMYELLTVEAATRGDRKAAYQALLAHPLGPSAENISAVLEDMLRTNQAYLPAFFR